MTSERGGGWVWLLPAGLGLLLYAPVLNAFFAADDFGLLYGVHQAGALGVWSLPPNNFFRPLISLSLFLDHWTWGFNPLGFHLMNLLLHLLNSSWVYRIARALGFRQEMSGWAGTLFLVLTCHVEATAWISGRTDLIATLLCLISLDCYIRSRMQGNNRMLIVAYSAFALSLMAKETAIVTPLLFLLFEWRFRTFPPSPSLKPPTPQPRPLVLIAMALLLLGGYLLVRTAVVGSLIGGYGTAQHLKVEPLSTLLNMGMHLFKTLLPASLGDASQGGLPAFLILGIALLFLWMAASIRLSASPPPGTPSSRHPLSLSLTFLLVASFISVLPTATLKLPLMTAFNDRFTYLPSVWAVLLLCWCLNRIAGTPRTVIASGFILLYGLGTWQSCTVWSKAGQLTQSYLFSLKGMDFSRPLLFLSVPDSYRSAYIFRNGLPEAIELFVRDSREETEFAILSKFTKRFQANTAMEPVNGSPGEFRLTDPRDHFMPPEREPALTHPIQYDLNANRLFLHPQPEFDAYTLIISGSSEFRKIDMKWYLFK